MRHEQEIPNSPCVAVIFEHEQIGCSILSNCFHHRIKPSIWNRFPYAGRPALQLKRGRAFRAGVIDSLSVRSSTCELIRRAGWTVQVLLTPPFCYDTSSLTCALVRFAERADHLEVHIKMESKLAPAHNTYFRRSITFDRAEYKRIL